ncbi:SGT1 protein [Heterostelium album PN500]|uniref:SGT1 protein n=1 Tax=Heterostelium pallidum (strain ATCC 26659 / Pp 5 / PN500) TaxID=670386 RepID=D3B137_HETP5|nr:SGT1 protein [Heterostelium album PN500]EFA85011.1 SGT1 protein [Heterostelium album PN500]|eukprot:XP_020437121.1 SGT1 protein [Heterostelium album PN500]
MGIDHFGYLLKRGMSNYAISDAEADKLIAALEGPNGASYDHGTDLEFAAHCREAQEFVNGSRFNLVNNPQGGFPNTPFHTNSRIIHNPSFFVDEGIVRPGYFLNMNNPNACDSESIESVKDEFIQFIKPIIGDYIWQLDPFFLNIDRNKKNHLYGKTRVNDSIEDEWFIVYLLVKLSERYREMSLTVRDNDGEFLLIEAAAVLQKWMKPATTHNRVFIRAGQITVLPMASSPAELDILPYKIDVDSALALMKSSNSNNINNINNSQYAKPSTPITNAINQRLSRFANGKYQKDQHQISAVSVPREVAYLLYCYPQVISDLVRVFCDRDPEDMASLVAMKRFPYDADSHVDCKIRFTRCLYAQIKQQRFNQPRQFKALPKPSAPNYSMAALGVKLHCAMEILYSRKTDHTTTLAWQNHLNHLKRSNYFGEEIKGSKLYKEKLEKAKKDWQEKQRRNDNDISGQNMRSKIAILIDQCLGDPNLSRESMMNFIQQSSNGMKETSDKWMDKIPTRYEDLLSELENKDKDSANMDINNITKSFQKMLNTTSSFEGIDFSSGLGSGSSGNKNNGGFDPEKFLSILKGVAGIGNEDHGMDLGGDGFEDEDDDLYKNIADYDFGEDDDDYDNEEAEDSDDEDRYSDSEQDSPLEFDYENIHMSNLKENGSGVNSKQSIGKYMKQMDFELSKTTVGQSFEKVQMKGDDLISKEQLEQENINRPVDLNFNLVKNIIGSLSSQQGLAGPASTLLKEFIENKK